MVRRLMLTCMVALYDTLPSTTVFMVAVSIVTLVFEREAKPYIDPFLRCATRAMVEHSLLSSIMTVVEHSMSTFTQKRPSLLATALSITIATTHHPSPATSRLLTRHPPTATHSACSHTWRRGRYCSSSSTAC